ncbi:hypothetical protein [Vibrio gazogenes]|uniref:Prenylated flavin chaperone LpdD-like domain-containing protein n=1 Tax=Vibrio gazogenes DSM 21264 = NBRC 103151 TaxID=1123492 RepID=A0A1M4SII0_VIBGA|nr:hypothetical protein [Vibrio gazogenes]USP15878.1 hypothetical protein MKS89_15895 [Vibrio gazogenes]SHE31996.1 hypothetical protein SAMN02745781_00077 [Vibrio gazogenes DSM 21264] [Vibrio gazogenes DSM 21264 = NBRC 103151]SJN57557.1 hypothetical protein BQ6471_02593 [Vibrio gazogenes]
MTPYSSDHIVQLALESAGIVIELVAVIVGRDLLVTIHGGDAAHIGAVALAQPRASLQDASKVSASTSVLCVLGHKEDLLAHRTAQVIASALNCVVSVSCGIHIDQAKPAHLTQIADMVDSLVHQLIDRLQV